MAINNTQKQAAKAFVQEWTGKGYEKGETQRFWLSLLHTVFGIDNPMKMMEFELPVRTITKEKGSDFIDAYITPTKVLIEQKGSHVDLNTKYRQSDGAELSPYQQARRYAAGLPHNMNPRWIVACNFTTFEVHDMEHPNDAPQIIQLADLEKDYHRLSFLVDDTHVHLKKELEVSIQAGEIVGILYDKILAQYKDPSNPESQKSLNKLCVRLVFCLYAEDAGIFGTKDMFHNYMQQFEAKDFRKALIELFQVLDTKPEDRDEYMEDDLAAFPYVNGGMFAGDIEIPRINDEIRELILQRASDDFDWSLISPTIFGAVFESTLNPATRRAGGMHYTSIENIHKVIDPLFLDELKAEMADIKATSVLKVKKERASAFQNKISGLKFFDPACGSGNFLTESYTCLRRLENEALRIIYGGDRLIGEMADPIKVSINQFYGIEINDFACSVAQTALWIAESQMMQETDAIVGYSLNPLPLKTYNNIHEGNALRMDWNEVVPASELDYIMGNPPFLGARIMSSGQKDDLISVFGAKWRNIGNMDYVTGWYKKSLEMMQANSLIRAALVSTNSITQGEQVANLWGPLMKAGIHIDFAWRSFIWDSEANDKAQVHCVIVGFSIGNIPKSRIIFDRNSAYSASNINGYLIEGENVVVESRQHPLFDVPEIGIGNKPIDGGNYLFKDDEKEDFVKKEPGSEKYFIRWYGSEEFINKRPRWCLWLGNANPVDLLKLPECMKRIAAVRDFRLASSSPGTVKLADKPTRFHVENMPTDTYLLIPRVSSERRFYIPIGFMSADTLTSDSAHIAMGATLYHFGVLTSLVHNAWLRVVCGRLKSDFRYSKDIVYNNFPWPDVTEEQKAKIEGTAQAILDARQVYPDASMADLYGNLILFPELMKAHRANDAAVLEAYGFPKDATESDIVSRLFKMYQELTR
ncbi:MAG: N-6 DNA methylase [Bacteroidales bacterium]|nr:N-6 DNA methylase [Bacteroidales bacterium]MDY6170196.1 DNA methyltransferase [Candidatus Cryptobacteroides sp.]